MSTFLIDINYVNFAWGYQNHGHLITSDGEIRKYRITRMEDDTLKNKLRESQVIKTIPPQKVHQLYQLLLQARNEIPSEKVHTAYDAGSTSYTGYIFRNGDVEEIELSEMGDFTGSNLNPAAQELVNQIKQLIS